MPLIFLSEFKPEASCKSSLVTDLVKIPDEFFKPLEFWHIQTHDRTSLVNRIAPYMVAHLPTKHLIQTVAARYGWTCEIFLSGSSRVCWQEVVTEFWESPNQTIKKLLVLTQAWFYTLLRYTYRLRFSIRGKRCENNFVAKDMYFCKEAHYSLILTEREIHRLTGTPNKYGATFYRSCLKDVWQYSDWRKFCGQISWFCESIQFPTHSESPDQILEEIGGNLPSVILQRRWSHTRLQLKGISSLAIGTANDLNALGAKTTLENSSIVKRMRQMEQTMKTSQMQYKSLFLAYERMAEWKRNAAALTESMKKDCEDSSGTPTLSCTHTSLEEIVSCRWLLENLPVTTGTQKRFGIQWRSFWQLQWNCYNTKTDSGNHPLQTLKGDERYNVVGRNLYGIPSNVLHGYGHLHHVPLHPDVQKLMKITGSVHYNKNKEINIHAERKRWLTTKTPSKLGK